MDNEGKRATLRGPPCVPQTKKHLAGVRQVLNLLGWMMGFEPTTTGITIQDSTAELHPPLIIFLLRHLVVR